MTTSSVTGPNRHDVYTGRTTNWPMAVLEILLVVPLVFLGGSSNGAWRDPYFVVPIVLIAVAALANLLTATNVRATAGPNGFTIRWGLIGWPRSTYHIDQIEHAEVINLSWWLVTWGFWWTPKRTCCTVRGGPTVRLTLRNKRTVTITVPEPDTAVAALRSAMANRTQ